MWAGMVILKVKKQRALYIKNDLIQQECINIYVPNNRPSR